MGQIGDRIFQWRWGIGILLWLLCILFELHGSSIGVYSGVLHTPDTALWGVNRPVRSDEWLVNTPFAFSQYFNGFGYFSHVIRAAATDMYMVYGQAVKDIAVVFRPFQWGYLFLSVGKGLAFFWTGRLIFLFLVSLEFGMLVCEQRRMLAFVYAVGIALAPLVQWWFAVNSIAEILIFGQLGVMLILRYLVTDSLRQRCFMAVGLVWVTGVYIFSLYPAWQVPCAYVLLAVLAGLIAQHRQAVQLHRSDLALVAGMVALLAILLVPIFEKSMMTIELVRQTVYPGSRLCQTAGIGGLDFVKYGLNYAQSLWLPIKEFTVGTNNSEAARLFDLAPLGVGLAIAYFWGRQRRDTVLRNLLMVQVLFIGWCFFTWPVWFAKVTLMSNVNFRIIFAIGLVNLLLLVRTLAIWDFSVRRRTVLLLAVLGAGIALFSLLSVGGGVLNYKYYAASFALVALFWYLVLCGQLKGFALLWLVVLLFAGGRVNPVAQGTASIYESPIVVEIQRIAAVDKGKWLVVDDGVAYNNVPIMAGASTINSTNVYPVLPRWEKLDPQLVNKNVYNRYAHIPVELVTDPTEFVLLQADAFRLRLNVDELSRLEVKYILSTKPPEMMSIVSVRLLKEYSGLYIYRVKY